MVAPDPSYAERFPEFCNERQSDERGGLTCDLRPGHGGDRHREQWVATWRRDGSDVRYFNGVSRYVAVSA